MKANKVPKASGKPNIKGVALERPVAPLPLAGDVVDGVDPEPEGVGVDDGVDGVLEPEALAVTWSFMPPSQ